MTIIEFIQKAIEGGWKCPLVNAGSDFMYPLDNFIFLDPLAWQAVGKTEGWNGTWSREVWTNKDDQLYAEGLDRFGTTENGLPAWRWYMHRMVDSLAEGRSLEDFISTL